MRRPHIAFALVAAAALAAPVIAQPGPGGGRDRMEMLHGSGTPADVKAGTYAVEPAHTQVTFSVSHMGISPFAGTFSGASGSLTLDPNKLSATKLSVTIPTTSVQTTSSKLSEELVSADWLDAGKFPTATFVATSVTPRGPDAASIDGTLTLHGVSKPITIIARFFGAAQNPMSKKDSIGFLGRALIKRSDFGVSKYVPVVSDETVLVINAAFEKQ
ncbi:YceI family protein [Novosphingobium sp. ST904]|uniref:YceI family protein n=1 Tax=Novosphingobium sp. ST904 TaxID=1684385 RepID=UPI0010430CB9|nr:YceI family protein [Novosphingobium sp. ST904]TCM42295.1 polyisoprenoid-binding protein YceI [Novosphingobium sp. ST904]